MNLLKKLPNKTVEMVHKLAGQLFHLAEPENNLGAFLITAVRYGKKKKKKPCWQNNLQKICL